MLNANDQHSDPRPNPRPRPRTSYGALHSFFSRSSSDNAPNPLRPAASSCDLKRHTIVDLERSADSTLSTFQTTNPSQSYSPTSGSHRLEQKAVALGNSLRRRFSVVKSIRKHASVSRGRPTESEVAVQTSATAVSPAVERRSSRIQRRSSSPEYTNVRRPIFARDRFRRNAISFHPGQHTSTSSNELLELSQQQAPQQFAIGGGAGAKAAVAQMAEERKMQLQTRQDVLDQQKHMMLFGEPMEVDSAFGDESDEGVALTIPQPFVPIRKDIVTTLPPEICFSIMEYLDMSSLSRCHRVSKTWKKFASTNRSWRSAYINKFGDQRKPAYIQFGGKGLGRTDKNPQQDWKRMAMARIRIEENWTKSRAKAVYFQGHTDSVYCCQFDEDKIITGSRDRTIRVWDIHTYKCIRVIGGPAARPLLPMPNETPLDTVSNTIWAGENVNGTPEGDSIYHVPKEFHGASILCLQYDKEIMVTGSSDATCLVWDMKTYNPIARLKHHDAGVLDVCLDANYIISCSKDHTICVWSRRTFKLVKVLRGHIGPVNAVQLRSNFLVSASGDGRCKLWYLRDLETKHDMNKICVRTFQSGDRGLAAVEFSDDGAYILAGGNDQIIYKFEVRTGIVVDKYTGHTGLVRSLFLDYNNRRVLSGSYDQSIRVYNFDSIKTTGNYDNWTTSWILAAKSDYRRIVATSQDGRALLIDFGMDVEDANLLSGPDVGRQNVYELE